MKNKEIQEIINLYNSKKLDLAEKEVIRLIKIEPNNSVLFNIFGAILTGKKRFDQAIINYKKSIKINPNYAEAYNNLGIALNETKKFDESIDSYKKAIKIKSDFAEAYNNLGVVFKKLEKFDQSINSYLKAIKIKSNYAEAYYNYGNVLGEINKIEEAISNYKKAIKLDANFAKAYNNLGNLLKDITKTNEACEFLDKLMIIKPSHIGYKINRKLLIPPICESIQEIDHYRNEYEEGLKFLEKYKYFNENPSQSIGTHFFYLAYHNKDNLKIMKNTSNLFKKIIPNINYISKNIKIQKKNKKIKIGFISEFLTNHTIGRIFEGLIKNLNRKKFEILVFHTAQTKKGLLKDEIDSSVNKVVDLPNKIIDQHQLIEKENLDILFYTDIGMSPTTYFLAYSRLSPVQIVSWGHTETTGIDTIDYFLSSTLFEANIQKNNYSERLICLNQIPTYYEPKKNIDPNKNRYDLNLPENSNLYGCPQSLFKFHPDFDIIMAKILEKDPKGYIVLVEGVGEENKEKYWSEALKKRWLKSFPILNKKVIFLKRLSLIEFLSLCNCVDVLLDPLHFGAGYTFLLTTVVGTPTVTMPGTHLRRNMTTAAYKQMKISSPPIAENYEEYVNLAVELAKDKTKNISLREEIKISAGKYLYNNLNTLKEFEKFLEESYKANEAGKKLKDGYIINKN